MSAGGHAPKVNTRWHYTVHITRSHKAVAARITVQIVDPSGAVHPVEQGRTGKNVTNLPIRGTFSDYIVWPTTSRGVPLQLRIMVRAAGAEKAIVYRVTPRS
jgi:hypothetical protein